VAGGRQLAALVVLSPFIGEVLSSNVPASLFFRQPLMGLFAFLTYSVPVVLLRELVVGRRLSLGGLLIAGLAYGIFNEGMLARTLLMTEGLPIPTFDHYLTAGGYSFAWGATLLVWHALFSVASPIALVHWLWPAQAERRWLSTPLAVAGGGLCLVTTLLFFRTEQGPPPGGRTYLVFAAAIVLLLLVAQAMRERRPAGIPLASPWQPLLAGVLSFVLFGGLFLIAGRRLSPALFVGYGIVVTAGFARYLQSVARARGAVVSFCAGACASYTAFVFAAKTHRSIEGIAVTIGIALGIALVVRRATVARGVGSEG
jgi:hypothetical protein